MPNTLIDKYEIVYSSGDLPKTISVSGGKYNGTIVFHPDTVTLPSDRMVKEHILLHYHKNDFENILHILKTEKPVYLVYNDVVPPTRAVGP